jgi:hypothetical protein
MLDLAEGCGEVAGSIAGSVVGHYGGDGDASLSEERIRSNPEASRGLFAFVGEDLGVGEPGVVVNGMMQERVAAALFLVVAVADRAAKHAVATTVRDASLLLDIDVDQLAWGRLLIANGTWFANGKPGGLINPRQLRHPIPGKDSLDRGPVDTQVITDSMRTPTTSEAQRDDPMLKPQARLRR